MFEYLKDSSLKLERFPIIADDKFLAWDAADEYLINQVNNHHPKLSKVLIIEDEFGAIGLGLKAEKVYFVNDSILSIKGIVNNFIQNQVDQSNISFISPYEVFPQDIDLIILKIPKGNRYLEFILSKINYYYAKNTPLIAGSMIKYLNPSIYDLCQNYLSDFQYSLSWKKAKIITGFLKSTSEVKNFNTYLNEFGLTLVNYPNLFSSQKLDIGTRFLLENLEHIVYPANINNIIDVGSANGILGLSLFSKFPDSNLYLSDITYSAYESASATIKVNKFKEENIQLVMDNALDNFDSDFAEFIIINPPFHQNHKVSITTSLAIFTDCARVLTKNGALIIVANRHLGYHKHLQRIFSSVEIFHQNEKFFLIIATLP